MLGYQKRPHEIQHMANRAEALPPLVKQTEERNVGTRSFPFIKRRVTVREVRDAQAPVRQASPGSSRPSSPAGSLVAGSEPDGAASSHSLPDAGDVIDSIEAERNLLDDVSPAYLRHEESRRRLEAGDDLVGGDGVGVHGGQEGPRFARYRNRAAWVGEAAGVLKRWRRDTLRDPQVGGSKASLHGLRRWIKDIFGDGIELVAGQRVEVGEPNAEGLRKTDVLMHMQLNRGADYLNVSIGILSRLVNYFTFRPLDRSSLMLARGKANQYAKEIGMAPEILTQVLAGTVALSLFRTRREEGARRALLVALGEPFDRRPTSLLGWAAYCLEKGGVAATDEYYRLTPNKEFASRFPVALSEYFPVVAGAAWNWAVQPRGQ